MTAVFSGYQYNVNETQHPPLCYMAIGRLQRSYCHANLNSGKMHFSYSKLFYMYKANSRQLSSVLQPQILNQTPRSSLSESESKPRKL